MKLVYLIPDLASAGGTIRVLHNKVCWFVRQSEEYEITIVTTDQRNVPVYFNFPAGVRIIDLGINYGSVYNNPPISRIRAIHKKKKLHFKRLSELLMEIKPDVTITIYPVDAVDVSRMKDGSIKILEFHQNRYLRLNYGFVGIHQWVQRYRTWVDYRFVKKFDRLVVLTDEGRGQWGGGLKNVCMIPNAITSLPDITLNTDSKRVIAVGRLVYEKGFDRLIKAWARLPKDILSEWELAIYGEGVQYDYLSELIKSSGVSASVCIMSPTKQIFQEYARSAFLVMSSHSEGLPMVLIEAMSCGLPAICFDFPCGPKDVIEDGVNGFLVENGDIQTLSQKMEILIRDQKLRQKFSEMALQIKDRYSEEKIMGMWVELFKEMTSDIRN